MDNKRKETRINELEAWLYFISSDRPEDIQKVVECHPKFYKMYEEVARLRYHPEEVVAMFSEALSILDENTVKYMIDEMKQERDQALEEKERALEEKAQALERIKELEKLLEEKQGMK